jgi:hypothetical protein
VLHADGRYVQRRPAEGEEERSSHRLLLRDPWGLVSQSGGHPTVPEPAPRAPKGKRQAGGNGAQARKRAARKGE